MTSRRAANTALRALCPALLLSMSCAKATDIPGVHPVAFDQPQINAALVRPGETAPLDNVLLGDFNFTAFLDTGASGIVLDPFNASSVTGYDLPFYEHNGTTVLFSDVAVSGSVDYNVSEPLELRLASFQPFVILNEPATFAVEYDQSSGPNRLQIGPVGGGGILSPINVIGMPAMTGRVTVVDPKPADAFLLSGLDPARFDQLHTYLYNPGTPFNAATSYTNPGIPSTDRHVQLTMVDVSRFTQIAPGPDPGPPADPGADTPVLAHNPFIGPNPLALIDAAVPAGATPGVTIARGPQEATGSFLFDTGAAFSFISQPMAAQLNVRYRAGTFGTASPILEEFDPADPDAAGTELAGQFSYDVSGIGGTITVAGFNLDSLLLRTAEGDPGNAADPDHLRYINPPVIVYDITVLDPDPAPGNGDSLTLDGVFGMNMLVSSAVVDLTNPFFPVILDLRLAPFSWLVFDEPNARLGVRIGPSVDEDADDDGVRDYLDICPLDPDPGQTNSDADGAGDACDALPTNSSETMDSDSDGTGDIADTDDDDDGIDDVNDVCQYIADPGQENFDADLLGDACDPDDDNDGVEDVVDAFPLDNSEYMDTDGDGTGNNADLDDDNDGLSDIFELANDLDPLDGTDCPPWICPAGTTSGWRVILQVPAP